MCGMCEFVDMHSVRFIRICVIGHSHQEACLWEGGGGGGGGEEEEGADQGRKRRRVGHTKLGEGGGRPREEEGGNHASSQNAHVSGTVLEN